MEAEGTDEILSSDLRRALQAAIRAAPSAAITISLAEAIEAGLEVPPISLGSFVRIGEKCFGPVSPTYAETPWHISHAPISLGCPTVSSSHLLQLLGKGRAAGEVKTVVVSDDNVVSALTKIHRMGPEYVIIKKGEHGSILSGPKGLFIAPAYPLRKVVDPTGAGDSFVGGLIGYLAAQKSGSIETNLRRAILHGSVVASFCCEGFGLNVTTRTTKAQILARVKELEKLSQF
jgi:hypothetical protein